jgi:cystathionine beta-lyase/cystathionine gamma-synthase
MDGLCEVVCAFACYCVQIVPTDVVVVGEALGVQQHHVSGMGEQRAVCVGCFSCKLVHTATDIYAFAILSFLQVVYVEAISNPLIEVPDLPGVVAFAKKFGLTSVIDATFATPILLRPGAQLGFDLIIHSATKYLNGHSDIIAGRHTGCLTVRRAGCSCCAALPDSSRRTKSR